MITDWNMWLLTVIAVMSGVSAFAQSFNAIHQLWINLHNIRQFCSKKLGRTQCLSRNNFHPRVGFREFEDSVINIPTAMNTITALATHGKPEGFFSERLHGRMIHSKMSTVVQWEDTIGRHLMNPNANLPASSESKRGSTTRAAPEP